MFIVLLPIFHHKPKDSVAMFEAENYSDGRKKAFEYFDNKFFTTYTEEPDMSFFPRGIIEL